MTVWAAGERALRELVLPRPGLVREPLLHFPLGPADRPLVQRGQLVTPGSPLFERIPDAAVAELELHAGEEPPAPGTLVDESTPLRIAAGRSLRFEGHGRVLYATPAHRLRAAIGRHPQTVSSPVAGTVELVSPAAVSVRASGLGLPGTLAAGQPAEGRLAIAAPGPDGELAGSSIDVASAGAILVAGARVDLEVLGRARAMGVRGVIVGGLASRDLRGFLASEARQRAAMHGGSPFALLVLDGYGRRPIPLAIWQNLAALEGAPVAISIEPPLLVLSADAAWARPSNGRVRIAAGELLGREGTFLGPAAGLRGAAGVEQPAGRVLLDALEDETSGTERTLPLADLERLA